MLRGLSISIITRIQNNYNMQGKSIPTSQPKVYNLYSDKYCDHQATIQLIYILTTMRILHKMVTNYNSIIKVIQYISNHNSNHMTSTIVRTSMIMAISAK